MTATASYNAVPFMLIVAPTGSTKLAIFLLILFFSIEHRKLDGRAAVLNLTI